MVQYFIDCSSPPPYLQRCITILCILARIVGIIYRTEWIYLDPNQRSQTIAHAQSLVFNYFTTIHNSTSRSHEKSKADGVSVQRPRLPPSKRRRLAISDKPKIVIRAEDYVEIIRRGLDKPNCHRLIEFVTVQLPAFQTPAIFQELTLEKNHQAVKRSISRSNKKIHTFKRWIALDSVPGREECVRLGANILRILCFRQN